MCNYVIDVALALRCKNIALIKKGKKKKDSNFRTLLKSNMTYYIFCFFPLFPLHPHPGTRVLYLSIFNYDHL